MSKKSTKVLSGALATTTILGSVMGATTAMAANNVDELYATAYNATEAAKKEKTQESINVARKAVRELSKALENDKDLQANLIGTLSEALDPLQHNLFVAFYDILYKEDKVTEKESLTQAEINKAREFINGFNGAEENAQYVPAWSSAVDKFQQANVNAAHAAVEKAQASKLAADIEAAKVLVADLLTSTNADVLEAAKGLEIIVKDLENKMDLASVKVVDTNKVEVKLNKAVADTAKVTVELKQGLATRYTTAKWSEDKTTVVLEAPSALGVGEYNVVVTEGETVLTGAVKVEAEKAEAIAVTNEKVVDGTEAVVAFQVQNQYGTDMKVNGNSADLTIKAYNVTQGKNVTVKDESATKSEFTLDLKAVAEDAKVNDEIRLVMSYKGVTVTKVLTVVEASTNAELTLGNAVLPEKATRFQVGQTAVKVPVTIKDSEGKAVKLTKAMLTSEITVVSSNKAVADLNTAEVDSEGNLLVDLKAEGNVIFTAILNNKAGVVSTTSIKVEKAPEVASVSMTSPNRLVAANDEVKLEATAVDQYGDKIDLTGVTFEYKIDNGSAVSVTPVEGKLTFAPATAGDLVLVAKANGKEIGKVTFKVEAAAEPTAIVGVDMVKFFENTATAEVKASDVKVKDQYGRDYKLAGEDTVTIAAKDETLDGVTTSGTTLKAATPVTFTGTTVNDNEVVVFSLANGAKFEVTLASVKAEAITSYVLNEVPTIFASATADYHAELNLVGKTAKGEKVALVAGKITNITSSDLSVAKITKNKVEGVAKGTSVISVWNGATKLAETTVTVSDVKPVVKSVEFKEDFTTVSSSDELKGKIVIKDQYGVEIEDADGKFVSGNEEVLTISGSTATVVKAGKVTISFVSSNGLVTSKEVQAQK